MSRAPSRRPLHTRGVRTPSVSLRPGAKRVVSAVTALAAVGVAYLTVRVIIIGVTKPHDYRFVVVWTTAIILFFVAVRLTRGAVRTWHAAQSGAVGSSTTNTLKE